MDRVLCYIGCRICLQLLKEQLDLGSATFAVIGPATATLLREALGLCIHTCPSKPRPEELCFFAVPHRMAQGHPVTSSMISINEMMSKLPDAFDRRRVR
ncbi:hypothetical protein ARMSODRAFT_540945 [Armillaria solidipes]|uniref:Uroporphyrinogen-III cosynthase n=1 Tax=Armillaria solidipes TaxID=1076256 RepID=A0A2H3BBD9_9AGAR|nr:hypothetical protein ARMSODRAFT_540945 [Armillaria solidipes]